MKLSIVLEIARHELWVLAGTRRAAVMALLYLGAAFAGGSVYVSIVRGIENAALESLIQQGNTLEQAAQMVQLAGQPAYERVLEFFTGVPTAELATNLRESTVLPAVLWCSLAFVPFLILLTSFDQLASELQQRSACYSLLRVGRAELVVGKLSAHFVVYAVLMAISSAMLVALGGAGLSGTSTQSQLPGLMRLWLLLLPYGLVYLCLTSLASVIARQASMALSTAVGIMVVLRLLAWFGDRPEGDPLRWIAFLSPLQYHEGLWRGGVEAPLVSSLAYLLIAGALLALSIWRLGRRDL